MNAELDITLQVKTIPWQVAGKGAIFTGEVLDADLNPTGQVETVRADYKAVGSDTFVGKKEIWRIVGNWESYKGGQQIAAQQAFMHRPSGEFIADLLINNPMFEGLGEAYVNRLKKTLDNGLDDLKVMLDEGNVFALSEAMLEAKIKEPEKVGQTAVDAWKKLGYGETITWLDSLRHGEKLGVRMGRKIYRCWKDKAKEVVTEDPYRLLAFTGWFGGRNARGAWKLVDGIAQDVFSVPVDDRRRFHGAIAESLFFRFSECQDTIVDKETLLKELKARLGSKKLAERALKEGGSRAFYSNGEFWQTRGVFLMERFVAEGLNKLARFKQYQLFGEDVSSKERVRAVISEFEGKERYALGDAQKEAVKTVLENQVAVVTGGAGVGKTTVLKCIHECIEDAGGEVIQMALSGRASRRMAAATGRHAVTIAGFLTKDQDFEKEPTIIIDEASMLDLKLMYRILKKVPQGCRLVLVGDAQQLAPIGAGKVFHLLTKDVKGLFPTVVLDKVYRQEDSTGIPAVADAVRRGEWPELPLFDGQKGAGVSIIPAEAEDLLGGFDSDGVYQNGVLEDLYETLGGNDEDVQVLCPTTRPDPYSTGGINTAFRTKYSIGRRKVLKWFDNIDEFQTRWVPTKFSEGDKVIFKYNDWDRELFNGTLGVITKAYGSTSDPEPIEDEPRMQIEFDTGVQELNGADLDSITHAYGITVHKAQGSQFERVIIPIREAENLDRSWIYTAITRGVSQVVLVGDMGAAATAVRSETNADQRQVGLGHLLKLIVGSDNYLSEGGKSEPESRGYDPPDEGQGSEVKTTSKGTA